MGIFDRFPYSSTHEMNLDFMLGKATEIAESLQEIDTNKEQAEQAAQAAQASAGQTAQAAQAAAASQTAAGTSASQAAQHKTDAEDAADRAEAASDLADEAVEQAKTAATNASTAADGAIASATAAENRINALAASLPEDFTEVYNTIKTNSKNCLFYVGNGTKVSWSGYNESPITLSLGTNNYAIIIDNTTYNILLSDIITAAISAGITVDQSNNKLTSTGFLLYFDVETHTPKAIDSMTSQAARTAISKNPVLFAAHYKSFRGGLLVDYMYEHRIETVENGVDALNVEVEAIKAVSSDVVPSYFESNLSTKIPEIIDNMNGAGQNGTTFVFITDLHWETNYRNSPSLVKRVLDKTSVKNVFCGGDIINQGEQAEMSKVFLDCINHFRFVPNLGFFPIARGNHDDNSNWSTSADIATYEFDANAIYNLFYSQFADKVTKIGSNWAFYFDQGINKTRYIFVDTKRNGLTIDSQATIDCLNTVGSGWHVVFLMHFTLRNATTLFDGCDLVAHIVKAYNNRENGSYAGSYQTATYDFTNAVGKVDLIIGGHTHADYAINANDANNPSGIPIIATDTDSYRDHSGTEGTVDSQCFDVVTVNYSAKTVKCVRIGRGSDRDFTY